MRYFFWKGDLPWMVPPTTHPGQKINKINRFRVSSRAHIFCTQINARIAVETGRLLRSNESYNSTLWYAHSSRLSGPPRSLPSTTESLYPPPTPIHPSSSPPPPPPPHRHLLCGQQNPSKQSPPHPNHPHTGRRRPSLKTTKRTRRSTSHSAGGGEVWGVLWDVLPHGFYYL